MSNYYNAALDLPSTTYYYNVWIINSNESKIILIELRFDKDVTF